MQMSMRWRAPSAWVLPHEAKKSLPAPKVPVPKQSSGTLKPERPSVRYSIKTSLDYWWAVRDGGLDAGPCVEDSSGFGDARRKLLTQRARKEKRKGTPRQLENFGGVLGEVGADEVGAGAADAEEAFEY